MRDGRSLRPTGDAELAQDVRDVDPGRLLTDEELLADLAIRAPECDEPEYLELAAREPKRVRWAIPGRRFPRQYDSA